MKQKLLALSAVIVAVILSVTVGFANDIHQRKIATHAADAAFAAQMERNKDASQSQREADLLSQVSQMHDQCQKGLKAFQATTAIQKKTFALEQPTCAIPVIE
jgi:uncharacterized protein HemX